MPIRDTQVLGVFVLCNVLVVVFFYWVAVRPVQASTERVRTVVAMQERRLELYERQIGEFDDRIMEGDGEDEAAYFATQWIPYHRIMEMFNEFDVRANALGLQPLLFTSLPSMEMVLRGYDDFVFYDIRVSAVYQGQADALLAFVQFLDEGATWIWDVHMDFSQGGEAALRLNFSLFAFFSQGGIE